MGWGSAEERQRGSAYTKPREERALHAAQERHRDAPKNVLREGVLGASGKIKSRAVQKGEDATQERG